MTPLRLETVRLCIETWPGGPVRPAHPRLLTICWGVSRDPPRHWRSDAKSLAVAVPEVAAASAPIDTTDGLSATGSPPDSRIPVPSRPRICRDIWDEHVPFLAVSGQFMVVEVPIVSMHWSVTWVVIAVMSPAPGPLHGLWVQKPLAFSCHFWWGCAASCVGRATTCAAGSATHHPFRHTGPGGGGTEEEWARLLYQPLDQGCQSGLSPFHCPLH